MSAAASNGDTQGAEGVLLRRSELEGPDDGVVGAVGVMLC